MEFVHFCVLLNVKISLKPLVKVFKFMSRINCSYFITVLWKKWALGINKAKKNKDHLPSTSTDYIIFICIGGDEALAKKTCSHLPQISNRYSLH